MDTRSQPLACSSTRKKTKRPTTANGLESTSLSLSSYKDYPAHHPFINTVSHHATQTPIQDFYEPPSSSKAFPETRSAAILSALRNLQEKIRRLELEKKEVELSLRVLEKNTSCAFLQSERDEMAILNNHEDTDRNTSDQAHCNQALIINLAAAESRCMKLEDQLGQLKKILRDARADKTNLQDQKGFKSNSTNPQSASASEHLQMEKMERLEQEYLRLRRTQKHSEMKIHELERKIREEEHQRKLIQNKAKQLETNRVLLRSVSPRTSIMSSKEKKVGSKKSSPPQVAFTEPHYRLSLRDVPFVAGTSVNHSHSVRANVQAVLSLLKMHQPQLCNSRVLSPDRKQPETVYQKYSQSEDELSELLQGLHEELGLMSLEHDELLRKAARSVSEVKRNELQNEQERLLLKMEKKGEQISKLYKHKSQMVKFKKTANSRENKGNETRVCSRRRCAGGTQTHPGERSKMNLKLLKDMKSLRASLTA